MAETATTGTTTVLVRYFAAAAEAAGVEEERLELAADAATLGALRNLLVDRYGPPMARVVASGSFLINGVVRRDPETRVGAQVDVLPPFAGG
ncbi:MoaD/ThiS family protein [Agromyces sp. GXQ0307]|uniref:MoaD/ThiS family protein n=1 Tax=Agromyces sp. GXQ0307 TaxID=3377835 RepID=UPI00383AD38E